MQAEKMSPKRKSALPASNNLFDRFKYKSHVVLRTLQKDGTILMVVRDTATNIIKITVHIFLVNAHTLQVKYLVQVRIADRYRGNQLTGKQQNRSGKL